MMLMSDILNEEKADKEIIKNLLKHIKRLEGRNPMSKILFDKNGKIYRVNHYEELSEDDLKGDLAEAQLKVSDVQEAIAFADKIQGVAEAPAAPASTDAPAAAEQPAPTPETPQVPEVPAVDAPAAPAEQAQQDAPAADQAAPAPAPIIL